MNQIFTGHELEVGMLQRIRSWRDLIPGVILLHALRVCGAPSYVALMLVTTLVASAVFTLGDVSYSLNQLVILQLFDTPSRIANACVAWRSAFTYGSLLLPAAVVFMVAIPVSMVIRAGGLYAAGREPGSMVDGYRQTIRRVPSLMAATILPVACVTGLVVPLGLLALLDRIPSVGDYVSESLAILVVPLLILLGLIAAGAATAIPLAWAAISLEKKQDPFDALSRGYEYTYRRPVQCLVYFLLCFALSEFTSAMARTVCKVAGKISLYSYDKISSGEPLPGVIEVVLTQLPHTVWLTTFFASLGATYLLLRKHANQQEIEDVAVSPIDNRRSELPSLNPKA